MDVDISQGHHLHVRSKGEGAHATVLLHGWALSGRVWDEVWKRWPEDLGRLVIPDQRGAGWSSKPNHGYQLADYARDVTALVKAMGLRSITLVGHSMAGAVAQLAALDPELSLGRLILVSPVPASGVPLPVEALGFFRSGAGHRATCWQVIRSAMAKDVSQETQDKLLSDASSVAVESYLEGFEAWRSAAFAEHIGKIAVPTLVLGGDAEPYLPAAFLNEAVVSKIPGATFQSIPGAGHYPHVETPEAFCEIFFAALRAR